MFKAVTTWQAEDYDITVMHGGFATVGDAAFSASGRGPSGVHALHFADGRLMLQFNDGDRLMLSDSDIEVRVLKGGAVGATRPLMSDDFETVLVRISDFAGNPDLRRGFESQGYGVRDASGQPVPLPAFVD